MTGPAGVGAGAGRTMVGGRERGLPAVGGGAGAVIISAAPGEGPAVRFAASA